MPLNKGKLTRELTALFTPDSSEASANLTPEQVAEKLATIIDDYIKSGTVETSVTVTLAGQPIATSLGPGSILPGPPAAGNGIGSIK